MGKKKSTATSDDRLQDIQAQVAKTIKKVKLLEAKYNALVSAGTLMSNWCQMLAMQSGRTLDEMERNSLRDAYEKWDKVVHS